MILDKTTYSYVGSRFLLHTCTEIMSGTPWICMTSDECIVECMYTRCSLLFELCRCPRYTSGTKQDRFIVLDIFWPSLERRRRPHERRRRDNPVPRAYVAALSIRGYPVSPLWDCANWKETFLPSREHVDSHDSLAFFARLLDASRHSELYWIERFPRCQMWVIRY